ncbi:MAG: glycosyltransferase, partial [Steroidobacteraceae bacterium]|nr:glycosyltransferase [Steroidobacteraceae bacterium]
GLDLTELLPRIHAVAWLYEKRPVSREEVPESYCDTWMSHHANPMHTWEAVRSRVRIRIELPHSVAADEFLKVEKRRFWDACIAGDAYRTRLIAEDAARAAGLSLAPYRAIDRRILGATQKLSKVAGPVRASRLRNAARRLHQRWIVSHARLNFVCGSGYRYPVRKFFEIPAARSALVCYPCTGLSDYGFTDGVNCLYTVPEDFGRTARRLLQDESLRDRLERKALELVLKNHSVERRASDLIECFRRLRDGRLKTAQFIAGEYVIE